MKYPTCRHCIFFVEDEKDECTRHAPHFSGQFPPTSPGVNCAEGWFLIVFLGATKKEQKALAGKRTLSLSEWWEVCDLSQAEIDEIVKAREAA